MMANILNKKSDLYAAVNKSANISDLDEIFAIEQAAKTAPWSHQMLRDSLAGSSYFWTITINDTMIGFVIFSCAATECEIINICIHSNYQNQGFGTTLLNTVIQFVQSQKANTIFLEVSTTNQKAIKLYETIGFQTTAVRKNYYTTKYGREDAIVLRLDIT